METTAYPITKDYSHLPGWGIDADPKNDPTYPMKHRTELTPAGYNWERPTQQPVDQEILQSIERPTITAVFGTSVPPAGLSGQLRRWAFKSSESEYGHWLPLLLADRVNVLEGIVDDLKRGHIPNIFAEKGWKASWQHDRVGLAQRVLVTAAIATGLVMLLGRKRSKK